MRWSLDRETSRKCPFTAFFLIAVPISWLWKSWRADSRTKEYKLGWVSANTRRTYLGRVRQYCAYVETSANVYGNPLSDPRARDYAIRDFKTHLKKARKASPLG